MPKQRSPEGWEEENLFSSQHSVCKNITSDSGRDKVTRHAFINVKHVFSLMHTLVTSCQIDLTAQGLMVRLMQCPPVKITYSICCRVCYKDWSRYLSVCCWHRWLCDSVIMNPFRIASYVNWHHFSKAMKHYEVLHSMERARKQRKTGWNPDQHFLGLLQLSHWFSGIGHIFDMHRPIHTSIYMSTNTHRYICTERDAENGWRERQCRPGTSSAASPDVENKSGPLSTGIHPQTACPPRRPLALYQPPHIFCRLG